MKKTLAYFYHLFNYKISFLTHPNKQAYKKHLYSLMIEARNDLYTHEYKNEGMYL